MKTILVVDDESLVSGALFDVLTKHGYQVTVAKNGEEGLRMALEQKPDLILLDIIMPKMDGISMMRQLREDTWGKQVPIIMLTNLNSDIGQTGMSDAMKLSPAFYLIKSDWRLEDILTKIHELIGT